MNVSTVKAQFNGALKRSVHITDDAGNVRISFARFGYTNRTQYQLTIITPGAEYIFSGENRTAICTAARAAVANPHRLKPSFVSVDPVFGIQIFFNIETPVADMAPAERAAFIKRTVAGHIASV